MIMCSTALNSGGVEKTEKGSIRTTAEVKKSGWEEIGGGRLERRTMKSNMPNKVPKVIWVKRLITAPMRRPKRLSELHEDGQEED